MDRAYAGSITWLSGVYWGEVQKRSKRHVLIRNLGDVGKKKVEIVERSVEPNFLFPLLRGRDLKAWTWTPSAHILVPHALSAFASPVALSVMKAKYPKTFEYLDYFKDELVKRSDYKQLFRSRPEFYVVGKVHAGAKARHKVAFKAFGTEGLSDNRNAVAYVDILQRTFGLYHRGKRSAHPVG